MISRAVPEPSRSRRGCDVVPPILRRRKSRGCLTVARYAIVVGRVPDCAKRKKKPDIDLSASGATRRVTQKADLLPDEAAVPTATESALTLSLSEAVTLWPGHLSGFHGDEQTRTNVRGTQGLGFPTAH
jgi:hypothetical protein